jgi:hypothetical protein
MTPAWPFALALALISAQLVMRAAQVWRAWRGGGR